MIILYYVVTCYSQQLINNIVHRACFGLGGDEDFHRILFANHITIIT